MWQNIETVPLNQAVLIAWGTKTLGAMGYEVTSFDGKKWSGEDEYGMGSSSYIPLAWMPLPPLPNK